MNSGERETELGASHLGLLVLTSIVLLTGCAVFQVSDRAMDAESLKREIKTAFGESEFPGGSTLLYDKNCKHDECAYLEELFGRRRWVDMVEAKPYRDDIFRFFSSEAFQYYLPAFMFIVLDQYEEADVMVDSFLRALQPSGENGLLEIEKLNGDRIAFAEKQRGAIARFLRYVCRKYENAEACTALRLGWDRYLGNHN